MRVTLSIVEDKAEFRESVAGILNHAPGFRCLHTYGSAEEVGNLSVREQEVLDMLAKGYLYKEISDKLQLGLGTIRTYIRRIYAKLHVQSRTEAVVKYLGQDAS